MKIQFRATNEVNKFYQDFIFDFEDKAIEFYNSLSEYPHSHKWYNVGDNRVTLLVTMNAV